jgi:hypothetical protein
MTFPGVVQREMGYALFLAQMGERHLVMSRTLKGLDRAMLSRLGKAVVAAHFAPSIPSNLPKPYTSFMRFRRSQSEE